MSRARFAAGRWPNCWPSWASAALVVATAVNGSFTPAGQRDASVLHEGDRVEVLAPMQGG